MVLILFGQTLEAAYLILLQWIPVYPSCAVCPIKHLASRMKNALFLFIYFGPELKCRSLEIPDFKRQFTVYRDDYVLLYICNELHSLSLFVAWCYFSALISRCYVAATPDAIEDAVSFLNCSGVQQLQSACYEEGCFLALIHFTGEILNITF